MAIIKYCTVDDIRDEGFENDVLFTDTRINQKIDEASSYIELVTGRFFGKRDLVITLDSHGTKDLLVPHPIIDITEVRILGQDITSQDVILATDEYVFYNRHLTQGLLNPDDRDNPKISLIRITDDALSGVRTTFRAGVVFGAEFFPFGVQNVQLTGSFGYTDPISGENPPIGKVPDLIRRACILLTIRELPQKADISGSEMFTRRKDIIKERVRDQALEYARNQRRGAFSGDAEIDDILARFTRPMDLGAA